MIAVVNKAKLAVLIAVALIVSGCAAPTQKISNEDRAKYKTARMNPKMEKAEQPYLLAPGGASAALMFGAIGGLAASGAIEDSKNAFAVYLDKNSVSIEKVVREEIELALRESGKLSIASPGEASAPTINIAIQQYGFSVPHLVSSNVVPVLMIKCDMVDPSGRTLWSAGDRLLPTIASPMESMNWEELRNNPKLMEEQWRKASRLIARNIVNEL